MTDTVVQDIKKHFMEVRFIENAPLCEYTTFKIGGPCRIMALPENAESCVSLIRYAHQQEIRTCVIGNGSNLLAPDKGYDGLIICTTSMAGIELTGEREITAGCGASLAAVSAFAEQNALGGMEFARGIPGTLGGAIFINAGAYGGDMKQCVVKTDYCGVDGKVFSLEGDAHAFAYRHSFFTGKDFIILHSVIRLCHCEREKIRLVTAELQSHRRKSQPLEYPSAGSVFKRPEGFYTGKLIQDCGLSGYTIGGAQVSTKHAGFIINIGGATALDVKQLVTHIQKMVYEHFNVTLECEIIFME